MDEILTPLYAECVTRDGVKSFDISPLTECYGAFASNIKAAIENYFRNYSYSSIARSIRTLNEFAQFQRSKSNQVTPYKELEKLFPEQLRRYREHVYMNRGTKLAPSVTDDWRAFSRLVSFLQIKGIFPQCQIPSAITKTDSFSDLSNNRRHNHLGPSKESFRRIRSNEHDHNQTVQNSHKNPFSELSPFASDDEWLDAYYEDQRQAFDLLRHAAIQEVEQGVKDFLKGRDLISQCELQKIKKIYAETGEFYDPDCKPPEFLPLPNDEVKELKVILTGLQNKRVITNRQHQVLSHYLIQGCTQSKVGEHIGTTDANARITIRTALANIENAKHAPETSVIFKRVKSLIAFHTGKNPNNISMFSPEHPMGLANLLGWIDDQCNGVVFVSNSHKKGEGRIGSFTGAHWTHRHGGTEKIRRHLGLTPVVAVAMAVIIIGEIGVNVEPLRKLKVGDGGNALFLNEFENPDYVRFRAPKLRKKREVIKAIKASDGKTINAHECFRLALQMTQHLRDESGSSDLWLYKNDREKSKESYSMGATCWKNAWKEFQARHPDLDSLKNRNPQLYKIRGTAGILEWFESAGSTEAAARKLGNSARVVTRHYIPEELMEAYYRRRIRRVQNIIILTATAHKSYAQKALNLSSPEEVKLALNHVINDPNVTDKRLLDRLYSETTNQENTKTSNTDAHQFAFIWTDFNIAICLLFAEHLKKQKLHHPMLSLEGEQDGVIPKLWLELASYIEDYSQTTPDRGHKIVYKKARRLMEELRNTINFPIDISIDKVS